MTTNIYVCLDCLQASRNKVVGWFHQREVCGNCGSERITPGEAEDAKDLRRESERDLKYAREEVTYCQKRVSENETWLQSHPPFKNPAQAAKQTARVTENVTYYKQRLTGAVQRLQELETGAAKREALRNRHRR
jgi:hypothetical protein